MHSPPQICLYCTTFSNKNKNRYIYNRISLLQYFWFCLSRLTLLIVQHSPFGQQHIKYLLLQSNNYLQTKNTTHTPTASPPSPPHTQWWGVERLERKIQITRKDLSPKPFFLVTNFQHTSEGQLSYTRGLQKQLQVTQNSIKGMENNQDVKTTQVT